MATESNLDMCTVDAELERKIEELEEKYYLTNSLLRLSGQRIEARKFSLERKEQELRRAEATIVLYKGAMENAGGFAETTKNLTTAKSKLAKNEADIEKLENDNATTDFMIEAISSGISGIAEELKTELGNKLREIQEKNLTIRELEQKKLEAEDVATKTLEKFERIAAMLEDCENRCKNPNPNLVNTSEEVEEAVRSATSYLTQQLDEITKSINEIEGNIREIRIRKSATESKIAELREECNCVNDRVEKLVKEQTRKVTEIHEARALWSISGDEKIELNAALKAKLETCVIKRQESNVGPTGNSDTRGLLESLFQNGGNDRSDKEEYRDVHQLLMYILEYGINIGRGSR